MNSHDKRWLDNFNSMRDYATNNLEMPEPGIKSSTGTDLYNWERNQRTAYKSGKLSEQKIKCLNNFIPDFFSKNQREIELYLKKSVKLNVRSFNPNVHQLYQLGLISEDKLNTYLLTGSLYLSSIIKMELSAGKSSKNKLLENLIYALSKTEKGIPEFCWYSLYSDLYYVNILQVYLNGEDAFKELTKRVTNLKNIYPEIIKRLRNQYGNILSMRYGIECSMPHTLDMLAYHFDITRSKASKKLEIIFEKVRTMLKLGFKEYDRQLSVKRDSSFDFDDELPDLN
jgi:hypothetical protein